jgi:hypothetical protein
MQIHEITQRPVNEVLGAMAKTLGGALLNKAASAVDPGFAQDDQPDKVGVGQRQAAAMKMNAGMIKALAKKAQEAWTKEMQNMIVTSEPKVMSAAQLDQIKPNTVATELQTLINSLAGFDVTKLAASKDTTGQSQRLAQELEKAKLAVVDATIAPKADPAAMKTAWESLATMISQAQNVNQFAGKEAQSSNPSDPAEVTYGPDRKPLFNGKPYNKTDPAHRLAAQQFGADPDTYVPKAA